MGAGNTLPNLDNNDHHYRMIYLVTREDERHTPICDFWDAEEQADCDCVWDEYNPFDEMADEIATHAQMLCPTGSLVDEWQGRYEKILYRSGLLEVSVIDNMWSCAAVVKVRTDLFEGFEKERNLAPRHVDFLAKKLFDTLAKSYDTSIRCGAYTAGKWDGNINNC